jgi:hypothetical protein
MPPQRPGEELPPGLTTLRRWGPQQGRSEAYVRQNWRRRPGFPDPVGEFPARGRNGGGRGELLFDQAALDAWLAAQPDLAPPERIDPAALRITPGARITLGRFAALIGKDRKTITQHRGRLGFPEPDADGTYLASELLAYWNTRTGRRGPAPI